MRERDHYLLGAVNDSQSISSGTTEVAIQDLSNLINIVNRKTQSPQLIMYSFDTNGNDSNQSKSDCQNPRICKTNVTSGLKYAYTRVCNEINTIHCGRIKLGLHQ